MDNGHRYQRAGHLLHGVQRDPSEPTVIVVPVFETEPDTGFGVDLGENEWAAPGLVTSLRKSRLAGQRRRIDVQALTDVNNMLFKILATPDR